MVHITLPMHSITTTLSPVHTTVSVTLPAFTFLSPVSPTPFSHLSHQHPCLLSLTNTQVSCLQPAYTNAFLARCVCRPLFLRAPTSILFQAYLLFTIKDIFVTWFNHTTTSTTYKHNP